MWYTYDDLSRLIGITVKKSKRHDSLIAELRVRRKRQPDDLSRQDADLVERQTRYSKVFEEILKEAGIVIKS